MKREYKLYLNDILTSITKIERYTCDVTFVKFTETDMIIDAVLNNLLIIGEASSQIPPEIKTQHAHIPWREITDFRNVGIHKYHSVNVKIVWSIIQEHLPILKTQIREIVALL